MAQSFDGRALRGSRILIAAAAAALASGGGCAAHVETAGAPAVETSHSDQRTAREWDAFWRAHSVSPPPPRNFLEYDVEPSEILNLTHGLLGEDVVRKWVLADVRRGKGDVWATNHLRVDIVNAGVLGPPGLNGSDRAVAAEQAKGTIAVTCKSGTIAAAGVVSVPKEQQRQNSWAELTDFVIVQVFRAAGEPCVRTLSDGTTEALPVRRRPGELSWQLDAGEFRDDPTIGPLWYQARGWHCRMDGHGDLDEICGLVQLSPRTVARAAHPGVEFEGPSAPGLAP